MARRRLIVVGVLATAVLLLGAGACVILRKGYSARREPMALEESIARRLRHLATPPGARAKRNPVSLTDDVLADGRAHFADHCAQCHANDGSGQTEIGRGLYPKPPDMRQEQTQQLSDGELFYVIRNGIRFTGMPGWGEGPEEEDQSSWALVHFIRRLPQLTRDELSEMQRLNPRAPAQASAESRTQEQIEEDFLEGRDLMGMGGESARAGDRAKPRGHRH